MTAAPTLTTERLTLRMPMLADFEHHAAFYASERSRWQDGPFDRGMAWRLWASDVGQWPLLGYGPFSVADRATGAYLGEAGIYHPVHYPAPDLGWFVVPEAEGKGIAYEAARAVIDWVRDTLGFDGLHSYISPGNSRSIALARRLGGRQVDAPGVDPGDVVFFHDLASNRSAA